MAFFGGAGRGGGTYSTWKLRRVPSRVPSPGAMEKAARVALAGINRHLAAEGRTGEVRERYKEWKDSPELRMLGTGRTKAFLQQAGKAKARRDAEAERWIAEVKARRDAARKP